jgi:hypothetical protein
LYFTPFHSANKTKLDGSGWTKVKAGYKEGLVPTSYLEIRTPSTALQSPTNNNNINSSSQNTRPSSTYSNSGSSAAGSIIGTAAIKKKGPAVAPKRGGKKLKYVEALYDYSAGSEVEHSIVEGERLVLIKEDPGDGWVEVERGGVVKSVPANYVQGV